MKRFVEHEDHIDIEESINGVWAVISCSLSRRNATQICKPVVFTKNKPVKTVNPKIEKKIKPEKTRDYRTSQEVRDYAKIKRYKISQEDYQEMKKAQNNRCAICGDRQPLHINNGELNIDHDHKTGKVRGLLCNYCNTGIGMLKDNISTLKNAVKYLSKT